ncbi:SGNH/GDSL hydrolase family protein, partial [Mycoplasmopsis bovis]
NIAKIVEGASSNDELVSKFIDDFGLTKLLSSKGISDLDAKELFKSILKSGDTKGALSLFINEFFKDTSKFKNVNSWAKLISTLVGAVDETKVKEHIKKWMRQIVNKTDNKLFDVMANLLTEQFNKNGYSIPEWENTKISKFLSSITKSIVGGETEQKDQDILSILNDIIDGIFTALKGLKDEDDILSKIAEAAKNGALKFITDNNSISIAKVFDNIPKFQKLLDKVDAKAYADFINVMFKYAHPSDDKGLFKAIFHSDKSSSNNTSLGFKGFWGVIQGKVQQLISAFVTPLMKNYVQELIDTQKVYKTAQEVKEKIEGYQAVWRVYASLAAMLYSNTPSGLFWNATNWTSEGFLRAGFKDAFEKAIKGINLVKYKGNYAAIGLKKENEVNQEFWAGVSPLRHSSTSNGLRWWRYARDYVLAYVYYQDNKDDKYHKRTGKTMRQVLIEDLIKGYMPVQK